MYRQSAEASLLVVAFAGKVFGVDRRRGLIAWRVELSSSIVPAELLVDGDLVVACDPHVIAFIDYREGTERKRIVRQDEAEGARAILLFEEEHVFIGGSGEIACYTRAGDYVWGQGFVGEGYGAVALALPGKVRQADYAGQR